MIRFILAAACAAGALALPACASRMPPPSGLVIRNVTVVSAERAAPLEHAWVRIVGDRITEVGVRQLRGETEVDGTGRFLIPGLIDSHVHLAVPPAGFPAGMSAAQAAQEPELVSAALKQELRSYLFFGFTTVVDLIGTAERTALWNAMPVRPDAYFCGTAVLYQGGVYRTDAPGFSYQDAPPRRQQSLQEAIGGIVADGAICVKTLRQERESTPIEEGRALVAAAHDAGLPLLVHANAKSAQAYAVAIGADVIVHGMWNGHGSGELQDDARDILAGVADQQIGYQPTMQVLVGERELLDPGYLWGPELTDVYPASLIEWYRLHDSLAVEFANRIRTGSAGRDLAAGYARSLSLVSQATTILAESDANLIFGSDTPSWTTYANPAGLNGHLEMNHWIKAGVSHMKLFRALTIDNARMFKLLDEVGTIEVGKRANLLLLGVNPLEDVRAYDTIELVFQRGQPIARDRLSARYLGPAQ